MCQFHTSWNTEAQYFNELPEVLKKLEEMETDGLLKINQTSLQVTEKGKPFVRNICMAFDLLLQEKMPETQLFSMTI